MLGVLHRKGHKDFEEDSNHSEQNKDSSSNSNTSKISKRRRSFESYVQHNR